MDRPIALTVIPENIPAELKQLHTWCCWRYEWNGKKWTKVPYTPFETGKAMSNKASTLRSFQAAYNCLLERADFFDGVFLSFMKDAPFAAGDFDHSVDTKDIPQTYAEYSPSGAGIRFIGRGAVARSCKKGDRELYRHHHFLSVTGHRLEGFPCGILPIQPELDALWEELKSSERETHDGKPGSGERAALAAAHDEAEWEAARFERRVNINRLLAELRRRSYNNKTGKRDTQLAYLLNENYTGFHNKWPHVGIAHGDGSLDSSQIRAVMANSIKGRGFTFPQFVALMGYFYGAECVEKWGTKQAVQEEFATLWHISRSPRAKEHQVVTPPAKRGRGSDHAGLLERAYAALLDHKVGIQAFITQQELADALNVNRRTAITLMQELRDARRIAYTAMRSNAGIVVEFTTTVINGENKNGDLPHNNNLNGASKNGTISAGDGIGSLYTTVINGYEEDSITERNTPDSAIPNERDEADTTTVINEKTTSDELGSTDERNKTPVLSDERGSQALSYIYITSTVYLSEVTITPRNRVNLEAAVVAAFDALPRTRVNEKSGELKTWPVTVKRVVAHVQEEYAEQGWKPQAITFWANKIRARRRSQPFRELERLKRETLEKKAATTRKRIEAAEKKAITSEMPELREWYAKEAKRLEGPAALLAYELGRRDNADNARIDREGYSQGEQQEMLELVEKERGGATIPRVSLPDAQPVAAGLIERLRARKQEETRL